MKPAILHALAVFLVLLAGCATEISPTSLKRAPPRSIGLPVEFVYDISGQFDLPKPEPGAVRGLLAAGAAQVDLPKLSSAEIEQRLPNEHPSAYYLFANGLWSAGQKDEAVFWFYAGQLRYRFHLAANPTLDSSGDPAAFAALQATLGEPINLYAGADPPKWARTLDEVLAWDARTHNGFTLKAAFSGELEGVRAGLVKLRDYIKSNSDMIIAQREQMGIGRNGIVNGVYIEERREKMPKAWPALSPVTSIEMIAGAYVATSEALLGPTLFFNEQHKAMGAKSFELTVVAPEELLVVAKAGDRELIRRTIPVRLEGDAVVFEEVRAAKESGLVEGGGKKTIHLRLNSARELVIQRDSMTEGVDIKRRPVKLLYTFWNRAKRASATGSGHR
jgi:hypothetical protein